MQRNTVTHITCLKTGDRFYLINDDTKTVWQVRFLTLIYFRGKQMRIAQCRNDENKVERFNANRVVVYLRSSKEPVPQNLKLEFA